MMTESFAGYIVWAGIQNLLHLARYLSKPFWLLESPLKCYVLFFSGLPYLGFSPFGFFLCSVCLMLWLLYNTGALVFWSSLIDVLSVLCTFVGMSSFGLGKFFWIILLNIFSGDLLQDCSPYSIPINFRSCFFMASKISWIFCVRRFFRCNIFFGRSIYFLYSTFNGWDSFPSLVFCWWWLSL